MIPLLVLASLMFATSVCALVMVLLKADEVKEPEVLREQAGAGEVHELTEEEIAMIGVRNGNDERAVNSEETGNSEGTGDESGDTADEGREMTDMDMDTSNGAVREESFYISSLTDELIDRITGVSYPDRQETQLICYDDLAYVHVMYYDFNDTEQAGEVICNKAIAQDLLEIFTELHRQKYQIESVKLVDDFGADDERSMAADNSSCFNYRNIAGTDTLSNHSMGCAIDINPFYNPYITSRAVSPAGSEIYADRDAQFPHKIDKDDLCYKLFTEHGFTWGGDWNHAKDYQHFEKAVTMSEQIAAIVVIDPGHGGENEGGKYGKYTEKELTPIIAASMKRELEKYRGIKVCLTRCQDQDRTLEERVDYAKDAGADFFCSLHLNMSEKHNLYGAECWISGFDRCYAAGNDLASLVMDELTGTGLFDRGIKTRFNSRGTDYYGVIRQATLYEMPSIIIEHCHIDNKNDAFFLKNDDWAQLCGQLDARAVAKYFGLKSDMLGEDFSGHVTAHTEIPAEPVRPDETEPDVCRIDSVEKNKDAGVLKVTLTSYDNESRIVYYSVSLDGGKTFGEYLPWPMGERTAEIEIDISSRPIGSLVVNTCNLYDVDAFSDVYRY